MITKIEDPKEKRISPEIVKEAEYMAIVTGIEFRLCLEILLNTKKST